MALRAKKELAPIINLTKPSKKSDSSKLEIEGHEALVVRMRQRHMQIESLEAEQKIDEVELLEDVRASRLEAEEEGQFYKVILVNSADGVPAKVIFKNMFKQIDVAHEDELRRHLKNGYDPLFEVRYNVKLRDNTSVSRLRELLGPNCDLLFEITPYISPKKDAMERRAQMRPVLDKKTNAVLDSVFEQAQYKPQLSLK